jgi:hypothetical protein
MNRSASILVLSVNSFLCGSAGDVEREIILCPFAIDSLDKAVSYYEKVAQEEHYAKDAGLSGIFHGMFIDGAEQVAFDAQALQTALSLLFYFTQDEAFKIICASTSEELCAEESAKRVHQLAQRHLVCAMRQAGFPITVPEDDAHTIFSEHPDREAAKRLLELNQHVPNTPEAVTTMRGALIAGYFLMQQIDQHIVRSMLQKKL